uniref:Uncharacterized protein n=1 Tax=Sus scrofa TaxID=9823 RepID=A0A8D1Q0G7_PIG
MIAGKGKMRKCYHIQCRRACIIYNEDNGIIEVLRNIPEITLLNISKLNFLKLTPDEHVGHFCIWTGNVFLKLDDLHGSWCEAASFKSNYNIPISKMLNQTLAESWKAQKSKEPSKYHTRRFITESWRRIH